MRTGLRLALQRIANEVDAAFLGARNFAVALALPPQLAHFCPLRNPRGMSPVRTTGLPHLDATARRTNANECDMNSIASPPTPTPNNTKETKLKDTTNHQNKHKKNLGQVCGRLIGHPEGLTCVATPKSVYLKQTADLREIF